MISIILENENNEPIAKCCRIGNERFLIRAESSFAKLSLLSECSYDVFASRDMPQLIDELMIIRKIVSGEDQSHIDDIARLAVRCRDENGLVLSFTPFD